MKQTLRNLFVFLTLILSATSGHSQCANDNVLVAGNLTPPGVSLSTTQNYAAGQYVLASVESGASYTISTCSSSSAFDTQITVYDNTTGTLLAYNDDFCGFQSSVTFTPSTCGLIRVLLDQFFCNASGLFSDVTMTMNTAGSGMPTLTAAPDVSACNGNTVAIGLPANGSGGTAPYNYSWSPATNLSSTIVSQPTATVTATQSYVMTLTDANGCWAYDTVTVNLLPPPVVNLGSDVTQCGGTVLLDAGNPGSTYLWSTGAGTQTLGVTTSGNYSVSVQDPLGCINSDNIIITINPVPAVSLGNDTATCSNAITLDAGSGYSSYSWSTGGTAQTETIVASGNVAVTITDANGCANSDTALVTLSPPPAIALGPDTAQCGGTVTLDAGNPGSLYFWSNSTSSQTTTVSTTGTYAVLVVSPAGCTNSDTINVTINYQPVVDLGADTSICSATTMLDAGNPGSAYLWNNAAITEAVNVGTGTWSVVVTDPSGCSDRDTIVVTAHAPPVISAGADQTLCPTSSATLTATGGIGYVWSTGATTTSISVSPTISTTYYVTGTDINGCTASDVVNVVLLPASNAQFTDVVVGATAVFTNQSTNAVSYSWNFGDASALDNTANPSHTYTVNGTYNVTLTVSGPCGTDTYTQVVVITQVGLQDVDLANTMSLYPNPNNGNFTLSFQLEKAKDVTVQVMDVTGRMVYTDSMENITSYRKDIDLTSADNGMYMVRIITSEGVVTQKIVVQK